MTIAVDLGRKATKQTNKHIHFKYIWAGGQDLILTSLAHLRKKAELKIAGVLKVRTWSGAGISELVCTRGAAFEMVWWWFGVFQ